jgi:hypothetical protein
MSRAWNKLRAPSNKARMGTSGLRLIGVNERTKNSMPGNFTGKLLVQWIETKCKLRQQIRAREVKFQQALRPTEEQKNPGNPATQPA